MHLHTLRIFSDRPFHLSREVVDADPTMIRPGHTLVVATRIGNHLIATNDYRPEDPMAGPLPPQPLHLAIVGGDKDGGIDATLFAAIPLPPEQYDDEEASAEATRSQYEEEHSPWKASVPSFEPEAESARPGSLNPALYGLIPLGKVNRPAARRKFESTADEMRDVLRCVTEGKAKSQGEMAADILGLL